MKRIFEKLAKARNDSKEPTSRRLGDTMRDAGMWPQAIEHYAEHLHNNPDDIAILVQYGHALKESGRLSAALASYDRAITLNPSDDDIYLSRGHALKLMGRVAKACESYQRAIDINGENISAIQELQSLSSELGYTHDKLTREDQNTSLIMLDVTDLIEYTRHNLALSGIQRVLSNLIQNADAWSDGNSSKKVVFVQADFINRLIYLLNSDIVGEMIKAIQAGAGRATIDGFINAVQRSRTPLTYSSHDTFVIAGAFWIYGSYDFLILLKQENIRIVLFIHDLIQITNPEYVATSAHFQFQLSFIDLLSLADLVLCNSNFVTNEVRRFILLRLRSIVPVQAVPLAIELSGEDIKTPISRSIRSVCKTSFALSVGTIEVRKNHLLLIKVWERLIESGIQNIPNLVFAGKWGWDIEELKRYLESSDYLKGKLYILESISDADLKALYANCMFTLYPSFAEGYGLPVGESLAFGKPCIASNTTSLPEVGGRFARYADPHSASDWVKLIEPLLTETDALTEWAAYIRSNYIPRIPTDFAHDFFDACRLLNSQQPIRHNSKIPHGLIVYGGDRDVLRSYRFNKHLNTFRMARASGWHPVGERESWASSRRASLEFAADYETGTSIQIYLKLKAPPRSQSPYLYVQCGDFESEVLELTTKAKWHSMECIVGTNSIVSLTLLSNGSFGKSQNSGEQFVGLCAVAYTSASDLAGRLAIVEVLLSESDR